MLGTQNGKIEKKNMILLLDLKQTEQGERSLHH